MNGIEFHCDCVLLDIEGTTSSISFVYDVMFPFVRGNVQGFLETSWNDRSVQECLPLLASDLGRASIEDWLEGDLKQQQRRVYDSVIALMDADVKATGLKQLQGLVWKNGFESGELVAHLYDDVADALRRWQEQGIELRIYSSGSVASQIMFFGNTVQGDLLPLLSGHYDTQVGGKREFGSYQKIAADIGTAPERILFLSDVVEELIAAKTAGMQACLSIRPGNASVEQSDFTSVTRFSQLNLVLSQTD